MPGLPGLPEPHAGAAHWCPVDAPASPSCSCIPILPLCFHLLPGERSRLQPLQGWLEVRGAHRVLWDTHPAMATLSRQIWDRSLVWGRWQRQARGIFSR